MKKRSVFMIVGGILVAIALVVSLVFVFNGTEDNGGDIDTPTGQTTVVLKGTWHLVANFTNDAPVFVENQFITFTETGVQMYKDATGEPYATSSYTLNEANQLTLSDIGREYKLAVKTANCIRLYDGTENYMLLIRNNSDDRTREDVTAEKLAGKWNVTLKAEDKNNGEALEFEGAALKYYKPGNTTPAATVDFSVENNTLTASALGLIMRCYKVNDMVIIFVDQNGIVWELTK